MANAPNDRSTCSRVRKLRGKAGRRSGRGKEPHGQLVSLGSRVNLELAVAWRTVSAGWSQERHVVVLHSVLARGVGGVGSVKRVRSAAAAMGRGEWSAGWTALSWSTTLTCSCTSPIPFPQGEYSTVVEFAGGHNNHSVPYRKHR